MSKLSKPSPEASEDLPDHKQSTRGFVPTWYKIVIGLLLLSLVTISLLSLQQVNLLQLRNGQLSSHSSNLDQQFSDLNKIVTLRETQVLVNHLTVNWTEVANVPLSLSCPCFQYSGYLHVNWTSTANLAFRVAQFGLNLTTPTQANGDFRIPVSSKEPFSASFEITGCPSPGCETTYSIIYHY